MHGLSERGVVSQASLPRAAHATLLCEMAIVLMAVGSPGVGCAQTRDLKDYAGSFTFENDLFFGSDRYYTDGVQMVIRRRSDGRSDSTKRVLQAVCGLAGCTRDKFNGSRLRFGQLMYTPRDITIAAPQPRDRPWAGLLYTAADYNFLSEKRDILTTISGEVGVTGPASLVEETQKWIHRTFTGRPPQGWGNQIGGELGLLASIQSKHALGGFGGTDGVQARADGHWRLAVGNIMTYAAVGLTGRVGKNLPKVGDAADNVDNTIVFDQALNGSDSKTMGAGVDNPDTSCLVHWLQCSAFASVEARFMARNIFLDGPLFRNGPHVTPRPLVADVSVGARVDLPATRNRITGPWYVQFKATKRSPEFRSVGPVYSQRFGALTVGTEF